mmetsp:Transcript_21610/g.42011  ORF Transcript_21610/g.42011 Transcript_21610/m.42011 type:complete len:600 (+) Transcript_21610:47-1846(+)|eukprot:CAMPEP_0173380726 /NCGR_PEP_ID=MMETSP1356-20130122/3363_1 /TAXON_ID=77927 ORGANISM="Hemiselmis virescens, Strain PCC157" /NCGR_SAMPLE_ID=MMETSP1356 /ASSEMBLY_ACC=CAM_ASM_000847 /LENGTH=599 /DNA_ID=CAMNT_0014334427 /DNA_START=46 /DNA_END=1845 /DNA_ORIENTATION=-
MLLALFGFMAPGLILVPRIFLEIVRLGMRWVLKIKGNIETATCNFSFEQYGRLLIEVSRITVDNPEGFDDEHFASVGNVRVSISPWGIFLRYFTVDYIEVQNVEVWIQQKPGMGINAVALTKEMAEKRPPKKDKDKKKKLEIKSVEELEEDDPDFVLSMLGLLSVNNASMAADQAIHLLDAAGGMLNDKKKEFTDNVKEAGGIHNLFASGLGQLGNAIKDAGKKAGDTIREGGVREAAFGAAKAVKKEIGAKVNGAADKAEYTILQQMLHRKVVGCYEESMQDKRVAVAVFNIDNVQLHSSGLLSDKTVAERPDLKQLKVDRVTLTSEDLAPHFKAKHKDCLPMHEFLRRVKVMMSHQIRVQNRRSILAFASAGVKERVVPNWLMPKENQEAHEYVQGLGEGAAATVEGTVRKAPATLKKTGSVVKLIAQKAGEHDGVQKIQGGQEFVEGFGDLAANTGELAGEVVSKTTEVSEKVFKEAHNLFGAVLLEAGGLFGKAKKKKDATVDKAKVLFKAGMDKAKSGEWREAAQQAQDEASAPAVDEASSAPVVEGAAGAAAGGAASGGGDAGREGQGELVVEKEGLEDDGVLVESVPKDKDA